MLLWKRWWYIRDWSHCRRVLRLNSSVLGVCHCLSATILAQTRKMVAGVYTKCYQSHRVECSSEVVEAVLNAVSSRMGFRQLCKIFNCHLMILFYWADSNSSKLHNDTWISHCCRPHCVPHCWLLWTIDHSFIKFIKAFYVPSHWW